MQKCMETGKPEVTIVMAVYRPNLDWLAEQLKSINQQSYTNIEVLVWDDCPNFPVDENIFRDNITNFPYSLYRSKENLGSNSAFEELTKRVKTPLISYCDQDDVWEKNKVEEMVRKIIETGATLVCSDLSIIDEDGKEKANSITKLRKRHMFFEGSNLAPHLMITNFVVGCAMMMKTEIAQRAIPFEPYFYHDQWLAVCAALEGNIAVIYKPLIRYRQHTYNQTGVLMDIHCKKDYYQVRIEYLINRINSLKERLKEYREVENVLNNFSEWLNARAGYLKSPNIRDALIMKKYKKFSKASFLFEIFMPVIPEFVFLKLIKMARNGIL